MQCVISLCSSVIMSMWISKKLCVIYNISLVQVIDGGHISSKGGTGSLLRNFSCYLHIKDCLLFIKKQIYFFGFEIWLPVRYWTVYSKHTVYTVYIDKFTRSIHLWACSFDVRHICACERKKNGLWNIKLVYVLFYSMIGNSFNN